MRGTVGLERQIEVHGLATILHTAILDARNRYFVEFDSSYGVHNTNDAILLQQNTLAIKPSPCLVAPTSQSVGERAWTVRSKRTAAGGVS
jgi:hypothetical protein